MEQRQDQRGGRAQQRPDPHPPAGQEQCGQYQAAGDGLAWQSVRLGDVDVFFLDHGVFVEPDGFWVRGGSSAAMVFAPDRGNGALTVTLQNAGTQNAVGVEAGGRIETWELAPFESRAIQLLPVAGDGASLRVSSSGGFRPSDDGRSDDRRSDL